MEGFSLENVDIPQPPKSPPVTRLPVFLIILLFLSFTVVNAGLILVLRPPTVVEPAQTQTIVPRADMTEQEKTTISLFQNVAPSVVFVTRIQQQRRGFSRNISKGSGTGSGIVWDKQGHILTNFHVVANASALQVTFFDGETLSAKVVGTAPDKDLAVLKVDIDASRLIPVPIGTSEDLQVGQTVFAIGNPFGLDHTLTTGIVSALGRSIQSMTGREIKGVIQTDAAINPGNSGGPLLDTSGRLIGINTAIYSPSGSSAGIGFAVPVDTVSQVMPELIEFGHVIRPVLGVYIYPDRVMRTVGRRLNVEGILIQEVIAGSGAETAGLKGTYTNPQGEFVLGDIVQKIGDFEVTSRDDLLDALEAYKVGDTVSILYLRDGKPQNTTIVLDKSK